MRYGILGGSFNPPHLGHLLAARFAREGARLERVLFVPAACSPHKDPAEQAPARHRLKLTELAVAGQDDFAVCPLEVERGGVSYTVDTLRELVSRGEFPGRPVLILGQDALAELPLWREPQALLELADFAVLPRPGAPPELARRLAEGLGEAAARRLEAALVPMPPVGISSSLVRERCRQGLPLDFLVPEAVARYIAEQGLYRV